MCLICVTLWSDGKIWSKSWYHMASRDLSHGSGHRKFELSSLGMKITHCPTRVSLSKNLLHRLNFQLPDRQLPPVVIKPRLLPPYRPHPDQLAARVERYRQELLLHDHNAAAAMRNERVEIDIWKCCMSNIYIIYLFMFRCCWLMCAHGYNKYRN